jgi:hypothetical protein
MAEKKITIEPEIKIGDITLIPVVEQTIGYYYGDFGLYFFANKKPIAIILVSKKEKKLLIPHETESRFDKLLAEMPQLASILNS